MAKHFLFIACFLLFGCNQKSISEIPLSNQQKSTSDSITTIDSLELAKRVDQLTFIFYKNRFFLRVWTDENRRNKLLLLLKKSAEEGLNPGDYNVEKLTFFEKNIKKLTQKEWEKYDILFTKSLQKYISHCASGKLIPNKIYKNWDIIPDTSDYNFILNEWVTTDSLATKTIAILPKHEVYHRLKNALKILNGYPNYNFLPITFKAKIIENDSLEPMVTIKKRLMYWKDLAPSDSITGCYDSKTVAAVKKFQFRHGLAMDGIIGKKTMNALNFSKKQRKEQIIANLERWRWYPKKLGTEYMIINIPDYKLTVVKNNDTIRTHRVIVGRPKRKTPIVSSRLTKVIFNPTWTVPPTILREDVIPAILKNRSYLAKTNIVLYDRKGIRVPASQWRLSEAKSYRYVQSPGTFNSLGMVKFIFPNRFLVYLHDTNHRDYFDKPIRDLSSGCVRVDNPLELTEYVLNDSVRWSIPKITATLQNRRTQEVKIKKTILFHLLYWTAWSEKNQLFFRDDIYNLDADLYSKLSAKL